jgi:inositol 2-dehydrogenase
MSIRIGLIGAGRMGKVFAHTLAFSVAEVRLAAVADPNESAARETATRFQIPACYTDYHQMLSREELDAVVVVTPTNTHPEVIQAVAEAGRHIFTEKPLAGSLAGCDAAIAAAETAGVKLQVGFMRRFDPAYVLAKEKIDAGVIGTPVMFKGVGRDPGKPNLEFARRENSGGLILDMGIHDFDLARWLMGSEVERVHTEGGCLVYPELKDVGDIDNAVVNLRYSNGAIGNIDVSRNAVYGYDIRTEVLGSEGSLLIGKEQLTDTLVLTRAGVTHDTVPNFMTRFAVAYAEEIRDFVRCILEDRQPSVTGRDARAATAIGVAATRSLDEGRPVRLAEVQGG